MGSGTVGDVPRETISRLFAARHIHPEIWESGKDGTLIDLARKACKANFDVIVAAGGDGTINAISGEILKSKNHKLGVLPMGTYNHFARDLGIPAELDAAVEIIVAGHHEAVDAAEVNGEVFVNNSSIGFYAEMVRMRERLQKSGSTKRWAALWASLRILLRFRTFYLEVQPKHGPPIRRRTGMLFVGNNIYETGFPQPGIRKSLSEGKLWAMLPEISTRWHLLWSLGALVFRKKNTSSVLTFEAAEMTVSTRRRSLKVAVDGEVLQMKPPLCYRILPKSLLVLMPAPK